MKCNDVPECGDVVTDHFIAQLLLCTSEMIFLKIGQCLMKLWSYETWRLTFWTTRVEVRYDVYRSCIAHCRGGSIQDLPKGADHSERVEHEPIRGSGSKAPNGVQGRAPGVESGGEAPEAESFSSIVI